MTEKIMDSGSSSDNKNLPAVKSVNSLSKNTKMFILPPNVLQNIHISDSMVQGESILSGVELIKKDTLQNIIAQGHKNLQREQMRSQIKPIGNIDNVVLKGVTKVPKANKKKEKLIPKINHTEQIKSSLPVVKKQKSNKKIDKSATDFSTSPRRLKKAKSIIDNVKGNQTTSNNVVKSQETETKFERNNSEVNLEENLDKRKERKKKNKIDEQSLDRSKRVRKQTKFSDYVTTNKRESLKKESTTPDRRKKCTPNKEQESVISPSTLSDTTEVNNETNNKESSKKMLQNMRKKKSECAIDSPIASTSVTPVVTRKSLPLSVSNVSEDHSSAKNNKNNFSIKDSEDIVSDVRMTEDKDTVELSDESGNTTWLGSKSIVLEHTDTKPKSLETNLLLNAKENSNDKNISKTSLNSANIKCIDDDAIKNEIDVASTSTPDPLKQENLNDNSNQMHNDHTPLITPPVRKRGRPRKTPIQVPSTSNGAEENLEASQEINDISIAEAVVHNKRHGEKSYNINNDGLSDDSGTESNTPKLPIVRKRGRPPGTSAGGGRGRGRGRGRGTSSTMVDTEYIPKLKGPSTEDKEEESSTAIINISEPSDVNLVICASCEKEIPKKQWNVHNLHKHNNMSWRKGDEPMDFENDIKLWRRVLMAALKKRKGQLSCEKCGIKKRSVNGFISHMQFCGKSDEEKKALLVTCPICDATMMPSSLEIHERTHRQSEQTRVKELQLYTPDNEKVKRKAAEKAVSKILEFTELVKDSGLPPEKRTKFESSFLKNVIKTPQHKKAIPGVWKTIWKKELSAQGTAACRQVGCTYTCSSFEDICKHFSECSFTPEECYVCKICKFSSASDKDIMKHVTENHKKTEEIDKCSDFEEENYSSDEKTTYTMKFLEKDQMYKIRWTEPYFPTIRWTMEFEGKHYELHLFNDYIPNPFTLLKTVEATKYLPQLEVSMRTKKEDADSEKSSNSEISWKQWERFEGGFDEGTATFFVGGPVWALAWLPIPSPMYSKEPSQYVAISTHPTMESEYTVGKSYSGANVIQIWNVGPLDNEMDNMKKAPVLSYAIAHNAGTIWCLEWCPSGCYQDENLNNYKTENEIPSSFKRMGMLAAASSDGNVYIYSLPFPEELKFEKTEEHGWPIYYTDPVITLVANISIYDKNGQNWQCTKLSWSKEHGHNTIAAGFSNGYIALWDLTCKSPLSMQKRQNTQFINAFQHFYAHGNAVSMIALVPYNGVRFLASGSLDRSYKLWDLEDTSTPQSCTQKGIIADGTWMTHWPCAVVSFDDALGYKHTNTYIIPLREHEVKYFPIIATNSPTYTLAVSDYANSIAHGTLAGEIITIFPHQLIYSRDLDKALQKKRKLSSSVKIVDFSENSNEKDKKDKNNSKDYCYMPETYNECKDRYGVIFCDNLKNIKRYAQQKTLHTEKLTPVPIEEYPFMSVNRISWNPNAWSYLWLVSGYQNGLVRLLHFKYMSMPRELKTWLPRHVERMLKKTKNATKETH